MPHNEGVVPVHVCKLFLMGVNVLQPGIGVAYTEQKNAAHPGFKKKQCSKKTIMLV